MIYNSTVRSVNESEFDTLLENAENRFEYETMAEASAIILGEQEANWTRFMQGVGLSELSSVMEGVEVIYEGARLQSFIKKAKAFFQMAINKLAEITKAFVAKVMQFVAPNTTFLKKYESELNKAGSVKFKGYQFSKTLNTTPVYRNKTITSVSPENTARFIETKDLYSREEAEKEFGVDAGDSSFAERVEKKLFGGEKAEHDFKVSEQIDILKNTKKLKDDAKKSYTAAAKSIKEIIKKLEKAEKEAANKAAKDKTDVSEANKNDQAYNILISYWKAYASCATTYHSAYMRALGARNRQAKAICTKALTSAMKAKGHADRNKMRKGAGMDEKNYNEGYVNTDAFLGAVEFI